MEILLQAEFFMLKAVSRVLLISVMLIAFIGQAIAFNSAMSCETPENTLLANADSNASEQVKQKYLEASASQSSEDCCGIDCCDLDCTCIANACSSFMYVETEGYASKKSTLNEVVWLQQADQPKTIATLLYRPPIFTS